MKDNFEHIIKNSLENHEVPYEAGAWEKFNQAQAAATTNNKSKWFIGAAALIVLFTAAGLYTYLGKSPSLPKATQPSKSISKVNSPVVKSEIISPKEITTETNQNIVEKPILEPEPAPKMIVPALSNTLDSAKYETVEPNENKTPSPTLPIERTENNEPKEVVTTNKETDSIKTNVVEKPTASFYIENTICTGKDINLVADNINENYTYSWKLNEEEMIAGPIATLEAKTIGNNIAILYIFDGEKIISTTKKSFTVKESPVDNVKIELNQASLINELDFEIQDASSQIVWNLGDGTTSTETDFSHTYKKAGKYTSIYTITAINGCTSTFERNINVKGYYNLRTDYGFSPGKRDNINDVFIPVELKDINVPFEMAIYARSGQMIYSTKSLDKPWDGKMKDGSTCLFGSYVWVVTLTNELGDEEVYKGTITNVSN